MLHQIKDTNFAVFFFFLKIFSCSYQNKIEKIACGGLKKGIKRTFNYIYTSVQQSDWI